MSWTSATWPGSTTPGACVLGMIFPKSVARGNGDWSARSSVTSAAWRASTARVSPWVAFCGKIATGIACRTPGTRIRPAAWAAESGSLVSTRTSAPALNAAWSWSEPVQL